MGHDSRDKIRPLLLNSEFRSVSRIIDQWKLQRRNITAHGDIQISYGYLQLMQKIWRNRKITKD